VPHLAPRSVVPGRQRWDVEILQDRPDVAMRLATAVGALEGIVSVRANPVTGRLLILHDESLPSAEVGALVRSMVGRASEAVLRARAGLPTAGRRRSARRWQSRWKRRVTLAGLTAGVALLVGLAAPLLHSPLAKLAVVLGATALIVRRAWRRSSRFRQAGSRPGRPLRTIVAGHEARTWAATCLSALGALLYMGAAVCAFSLASVLIAGPSATLASLGAVTLSGQVWLLGLLGLAACAMFSGVWYVGGVMWRDLSRNVVHEWRCNMYHHVQRAELGRLEQQRTTQVARVLTEDIDQFGRFLSNQANYLVRVGTTLALLVAVFVIVAPEIAWIALLPIPVVAWLSFDYQERIAPRFAAVGRDSSLLASQIINNLEASATIKSFGAEVFEVERIRRLSAALGTTARAVDVRTTAYSQSVLGLSMMGLVGVYLVGGQFVLAGVIFIAAYNTVIRLPQLLNFQLPGLGEAVEQYQKTVAALGRVLALGELPIEPTVEGLSLDRAVVRGEIVFEQVSFAYRGRPLALRNLSLRIEARATTAIVGATGSGKTTIAKLLLRLEETAAGRILLDGVDIRQLRLYDLRSAFGFVGQDPFLFDGTISENIGYGSFDPDADKIAAAARLADADGFITALPERYETRVGERGVALSGGQRQRISLARAIYKDAPVLVLDEATSAVDNETEAAIQRALADFAEDRTMVVIAHRLSTIRHARWIYVLGEGGVVHEEGRHDDLVARGGLYTRLWQLQIGEMAP